MNKNIPEILNQLDTANTFFKGNVKLLQFSVDDGQNKKVFDWFIDGGYLGVSVSGRGYVFSMHKRSLTFSIGSIRKDTNQTTPRFLEDAKITWTDRAIAYFYKRNQTFILYTDLSHQIIDPSPIKRKKVLKRINQIKDIDFDKIFINNLKDLDNTPVAFFDHQLSIM